MILSSTPIIVLISLASIYQAYMMKSQLLAIMIMSSLTVPVNIAGFLGMIKYKFDWEWSNNKSPEKKEKGCGGGIKECFKGRKIVVVYFYISIMLVIAWAVVVMFISISFNHETSYFNVKKSSLDIDQTKQKTVFFAVVFTSIFMILIQILITIFTSRLTSFKESFIRFIEIINLLGLIMSFLTIYMSLYVMKSKIIGMLDDIKNPSQAKISLICCCILVGYSFTSFAIVFKKIKVFLAF